MPVYVIAQLKIEDRARYQRYVEAFMPVLTAHGGHLLAADEAPAREEGDWPYDKVILLSFADETGFRAWADSPEYKQIAKDRLSATTGPVILAHGLG